MPFTYTKARTRAKEHKRVAVFNIIIVAVLLLIINLGQDYLILKFIFIGNLLSAIANWELYEKLKCWALVDELFNNQN